MRWLCAALAFALLVVLAVMTVALRSQNLTTRARIAKHNDRILSLRVEKSRRELRAEAGPSVAELRRRVREILAPIARQ